jgi:hypothetical protein
MTNSVNFSNTPDASGVKRIDSKIQVEEVKPHISSKKKAQATLRMKVKSVYPESGVGNSLNDSPFGTSAFGFGDGQSFIEERVAWIDVPVGSTVQSVQEQLDKFPKARLYRVLSLEPVLSEQQKRAMEAGISTYSDEQGNPSRVDMNYYKGKQAVVDKTTGEVITYKGKVQYRIIAFSTSGQADIDMRPAQYNAAAHTEVFAMNAPANVKQAAVANF